MICKFNNNIFLKTFLNKKISKSFFSINKANDHLRFIHSSNDDLKQAKNKNELSSMKEPTDDLESIKLKNYSLFSKIYPVNQDTITEKDVDEWISALTKLKNVNKQPESKVEIYLKQFTQANNDVDSFVPSEKQMKDLTLFENEDIPLKSDPLIDYFTNLVMKHGKKSTAYKYISRALYIIQLKEKVDSVIYLKEAVERLGPVVTTMVYKTGFAKNKIIPFPLTQKQRNRFALRWILEESKMRKSYDFSIRLAEEIISAHNGKSKGYQKKLQMHKLAIKQRAYILH